MAKRHHENRADIGKDSFFSDWWFFDTNCISELVKMCEQGHRQEVLEFVAGRDILVSSLLLMELRLARDVAINLERVLGGANPFLVVDYELFWRADISNFLNVDRMRVNTLEATPVPSGLFVEITRNSQFDAVSKQWEQTASTQYLDKVGVDLGSMLDERDLCAFIWAKVNEYSAKWFKVEIPPADCSSVNFPSFYTFYYTYFFRYMKNRDVLPEPNDFVDLTHCMAAPYCERYYAERTFGTLLGSNVKDHRPPTSKQLAKGRVPFSWASGSIG